MAKSRRKHVPKTVLKLPDLEQSKSAVLNSLTSASSKRSYDHAIREFIDWYCSEPRLAFNKTVVTRYRISLEEHHYASSTINLRLAAVRRLAYEAADCGLLSPDLAAGIRRVKGAKRLGVRVGNWLTAEESKSLLATEIDDTLRSRRNRALLALLVGCGLRRAEVTALRLEDFQLREGHWGNRRPNRQGRTHTNDSCAGLGQSRGRRLDESGWNQYRSSAPFDQQGGKNLGRWFHSQSDLGNCEEERHGLRTAVSGPTRFEKNLCAPVPPGWW
jgi:integrase